MSKTVGTSHEGLVWDLADGLPLILQDSSMKLLPGPGGLPLEQMNGPTTLYYVQDQLGSTRALLDKFGHAQETYSYDAYGNITAQTGAAPNQFLYAGQYTDYESKLQYLRARYYDPNTQQFLTVDPIADQIGQPYGYGGDNPVNAVDPTGLCAANSKKGVIWDWSNDECYAEASNLHWQKPLHGRSGRWEYNIKVFRGTQKGHAVLDNFHISYSGPNNLPGRFAGQNWEVRDVINKTLDEPKDSRTFTGHNGWVFNFGPIHVGNAGMNASADATTMLYRYLNDVIASECGSGPGAEFFLKTPGAGNKPLLNGILYTLLQADNRPPPL
jgi:RHS repeat-associated protein